MVVLFSSYHGIIFLSFILYLRFVFFVALLWFLLERSWREFVMLREGKCVCGVGGDATRPHVVRTGFGFFYGKATGDYVDNLLPSVFKVLSSFLRRYRATKTVRIAVTSLEVDTWISGSNCVVSFHTWFLRLLPFFYIPGICPISVPWRMKSRYLVMPLNPEGGSVDNPLSASSRVIARAITRQCSSVLEPSAYL